MLRGFVIAWKHTATSIQVPNSTLPSNGSPPDSPDADF